MAIVVTSKGTNNADDSGVTVVLSGLTIVAGSTLIACCGNKNGDKVSCVYNDGADDYSLTLRVSGENSGSQDFHIYSLDNVAAASGSGSVTYTISGNGNQAIAVYQVTGLDSAGSIDKTASATNRNTAFDSGNTAETSQADELIVGGATQGNSTTTFDSWTGTVTDNIQTDGVGTCGLGCATKIISSAQACNAAGILSAKDYYAAAVATFKAAAAPGGWTGKVLGVDSANIAKICGVAIADIAKVGGV